MKTMCDKTLSRLNVHALKLARERCIDSAFRDLEIARMMMEAPIKMAKPKGKEKPMRHIIFGPNEVGGLVLDRLETKADGSGDIVYVLVFRDGSIGELPTKARFHPSFSGPVAKKFSAKTITAEPECAERKPETPDGIGAEALQWLKSAVPQFFPGAGFEIALAAPNPTYDVFLRVYSSFEPADFHERRHKLSEAMLEAGHKDLYEVLGVFQLRPGLEKQDGNGHRRPGSSDDQS
jgi:hypothetical protein